MISLPWFPGLGRSEVVIIYPDIYGITLPSFFHSFCLPSKHQNPIGPSQVWSLALKSRPVIAALDPVKCHWCLRRIGMGRFAVRPGRLISGTFERKRLWDVVGVVAVCIFLWFSGHCLKSAITYVVSYICFFMFFKQPMLMIPNRQRIMNYRHVI